MPSLALSLSLLPILASAQSKPIPISIPSGRISQSIHGSLRSVPVTYALKVAKGQHVVVNAQGLTKGFAVIATVTLPNNSHDGNKGVPNYAGVMTASGTLNIRVATNLMASTQQGGDYVLEVVVY